MRKPSARSVLPSAALILATLGLATAAGCGSVGPSGDSTPSKSVGAGESGTCEATASSLKPVSAPGQSATVALGAFSDGPLAGKTIAFVADEDDKSLVMVDVDTRKELGSTKLDGAPGQVMVLADGRVLVTLRDANKLAVYHAKNDGTLTAGCAVDTSAEPIALATTPDAKTILLTAGWGRTLEAFDAAALSRKAKVPLPREPRTVVVDDEGKFAYVSHAVGARVSIVDLATMKPQRKLDVLVNPFEAQNNLVEKPFSLASSVSGAVGDANGEKPIPGRNGTRMGCQGFPMVKSTAPKGRILAPQILVDPGDPENRSAGYGEGGVPTEVPAVAVIDAGTRRFVQASFAETHEQFFGGEGGAEPAVGECILPRGAAVDNDSSTLFVTCLGIDAVVAYDAASASPASVEKARWDVGSGPTGVAIDSANKRAVVWSQFERSLDLVDLKTMGTPDEPSVGKHDRVALKPMAEPLQLSFVLGRQIFHATGDARISLDGRACASCHPDGRDDAITWSTPEGPRRSIMLAGRLQGTAPFSWNGLTKDVREHVTHTFERLNGQGLRNVELEALITYIESMPAPPRQNDLDVQLVKKGESLFHSEQAACGSCHAGDGGTDTKNHDLGSRARADRKAQFNTPSLSYISGRGPFFHDGRFESLRELLVESDGMMGHTKHLNEGDLDALEAYLNTL
ncbi:MAG: hypothetical protein HOW73_02600 [Polyangiaceae bacterium]|nr:hypothetical protein [Polyangiaceae bacterium]